MMWAHCDLLHLGNQLSAIYFNISSVEVAVLTTKGDLRFALNFRGAWEIKQNRGLKTLKILKNVFN